MRRRSPGKDKGFLVVTTTCGSRAEAERIAASLVQEHLAACAQVQGPVVSHYRWQGRVESAEEWSCSLKTSGDRYRELERRLRALHSYEVPEVIALPVHSGSKAYLDWIAHETGNPDPGVAS